MKYKLNVNKTKFYKLVQEKSLFRVPMMKNMEYSSHRGFYRLESSIDGLKFGLTPCMGQVMLRVELPCEAYDHVYILEYDELIRYDLLKEN